MKAGECSRVDIGGPDECWEWRGARSAAGYGRFYANKKTYQAHRFSLGLVAALSPTEFACHHCDNPVCVNPGHLFAGDHAANMRDMANKGRGKGPALAGMRNPAAIVTPEDAGRIRASCASGRSQKSVADEFGISQQSVSLIVRGEHWTQASAS